MLLVQKFLETNSFKDLYHRYNVTASFSKSGHKFSLNYDLLSEGSDPLALQCRGLILALKNGKSLSKEAINLNGRLNYDNIIPGETIILAYPMDRFFNYGQKYAYNINWEDPTLEVLEKLDGTLIIVYFDIITSNWCVATRSAPDADIINENYFTYRNLFEKSLKETSNISFDELTSILDRNVTYCFELTSPYNRVVVYYKNTKCNLLAARDNKSLLEIDINNILCDIPHVKKHDFKDLNSIVSYVNNLNPLNNEGVIVKDSKFNRIKIKSPSYVEIHKYKSGLCVSNRNCLDLILNDKDLDIIQYLPQEIIDKLSTMKENLRNFIKKYDEYFYELKRESDSIKLNDNKVFANLLLSRKDIWSPPIFAILNGRCNNVKEFLFASKKQGKYPDSFLDKILLYIER